VLVFTESAIVISFWKKTAASAAAGQFADPSTNCMTQPVLHFEKEFAVAVIDETFLMPNGG
jgi:hypothetical protein